MQGDGRRRAQRKDAGLVEGRRAVAIAIGTMKKPYCLPAMNCPLADIRTGLPSAAGLRQTVADPKRVVVHHAVPVACPGPQSLA